MALRDYVVLVLAVTFWRVTDAVPSVATGDRGYGRNLIVRTYPAVENVQSDIYEVYMEPYLYDYQRPTQDASKGRERSQKQIGYDLPPAHFGLQAAVSLKPAGELDARGELVLTQLQPGGPVLVTGNLTGVPAGPHGLHVHQRGHIVEGDGCANLGPHFGAFYGRHGGPGDPVRHIGDLGNVVADESGEARVRLADSLVSLAGPRGVAGRALVLTAAPDDLGRSATEESALTGSAGKPIACGVIAYLN